MNNSEAISLIPQLISRANGTDQIIPLFGGLFGSRGLGHHLDNSDYDFYAVCMDKRQVSKRVIRDYYDSYTYSIPRDIQNIHAELGEYSIKIIMLEDFLLQYSKLSPFTYLQTLAIPPKVFIHGALRPYLHMLLNTQALLNHQDSTSMYTIISGIVRIMISDLGAFSVNNGNAHKACKLERRVRAYYDIIRNLLQISPTTKTIPSPSTQQSLTMDNVEALTIEVVKNSFGITEQVDTLQRLCESIHRKRTATLEPLRKHDFLLIDTLYNDFVSKVYNFYKLDNEIGQLSGHQWTMY